MNNNDNNIPPAPSVADILSSGSGTTRIGGVDTSAAAKLAAQRKAQQEAAAAKVIENAHVEKAPEPETVVEAQPQPLQDLASRQLQARQNLVDAVKTRKLQDYTDLVILDQAAEQTLYEIQQLGAQLVQQSRAQAMEIVARAEQQAAEAQQAIERRIIISADLIDDVQAKTKTLLENADNPEQVAIQLQTLVDELVHLTNLYAQPKGDNT